MRCIEITASPTFLDGYVGLTLTWDVLKFEYPLKPYAVGMININMRCIEMWMRDPYVVCVNGLTLTWDVLKLTNLQHLLLKLLD